MTEYETQSLALLGKILTALESRPAQSSGGSRSHAPSGPLTGWRAVQIPFGKKEGVALGELGKGVDWWIDNYDPHGNPKYPAKPRDLDFRKALDEAKAELRGGQAPASDRSPDESFDVPF